ncbi:dusA [Symbiodinium natans]|uniref:DusA protein n=1 Tax=Symbiodinium natans TaxID=878477 RepID=A0A812QET5_9DINO|nr:dusA [Symbiodinium natans]
MAEAECRFEGRHLLQIAPMMEVTYRDFRYFMRLLSRRAQLWTEMVVDDTILHNTEPEKCDRFLRYHEAEHPIVCQLGGSDPRKLTQAAEIVQRYGYDEVNLNCGCPSSRVAGKGEFGCSLMKKKDLVRDAIHAMSRAVQIPVTVKCRLGADEFDSPDFTRDFVRTVAQGGCKHFIIHARKAWLTGLSPAQNRTVPPLHYPRILDLCHQFPDLKFSINGGITDVGMARALLGFPHRRLDGETEDLYSSAWGWPGSDVFCGSTEPCPAVPPNFEGVMIGRGAMNSPCMLWDVDHSLYGEEKRKPMTRRELLEGYKTYLEDAHTDGTSVGSIHLALKPTLGILTGIRGNKAYRATADKTMRRKDVAEMGPAYVLEAAMKAVDEANPGVLDEALPATVAFKQQPPAEAGTPRGQKRKPAEVATSEVQAVPESGSCAGPMEAEQMASPALLAA